MSIDFQIAHGLSRHVKLSISGNVNIVIGDDDFNVHIHCDKSPRTEKYIRKFNFEDGDIIVRCGNNIESIKHFFSEQSHSRKIVYFSFKDGKTKVISNNTYRGVDRNVVITTENCRSFPKLTVHDKSISIEELVCFFGGSKNCFLESWPEIKSRYGGNNLFGHIPYKKLYRGMSFKTIHDRNKILEGDFKSEKCSHWSTKESVAISFATTKKYGILLETTVDVKDVVFDYRSHPMFPIYSEGGPYNQFEVILSPGKYKIDKFVKLEN